MKLSTYYRRAVVYPSIFIVFFSIVYSIIDNHGSDWRVARFVIGMSALTSLAFSLLMCGISLTIFLNKFKKLGRNLVWNILTWFLLPYLYIAVILIHDVETRIRHEFGFGTGFLYVLIMTMPFVIGLGRAFIRYRQEVIAARIQPEVGV